MDGVGGECTPHPHLTLWLQVSELYSANSGLQHNQRAKLRERDSARSLRAPKVL